MPISTTPSPLQGTGAFGLVPGTTALPNPAGDISAQGINLPQLNPALSNTIQSQLAGNLSPGTTHALQNAAAQYGLKTGMPGLGPQNSLAWNNLFGNIAGFAEGQVNKGQQSYNSTIPTVAGTQTVNPATQIGLSESNAVNLAAPNPQAAAQYAEGLFSKYMQRAQGGGQGGIGGAPVSHGGGPPGADSFGNIYKNDSQNFGNPGVFGALGWPGGAQSGQMTQNNWNAWNASQPWNQTSGTGTQPALSQNDWNQMIQSQYPQLSGASPDDLAALGINPWDLANSAGSGGQGSFYAGANPATAPTADTGGDYYGDFSY